MVSYNATTFYDRDRKLQGVCAVARDVTERKRLDQALQEKNVEFERATAAAEKANLAKSDFLSSMSQELRSPLNAVLGFAQLINSDSPPPTASQKASIDQILHAGWYLLELINEILDLAQIESGRLALSLEPTSLAEVMFECQAMIEPQAQERGISMTFPQFDVPYFVKMEFHSRTQPQEVLNRVNRSFSKNLFPTSSLRSFSSSWGRMAWGNSSVRDTIQPTCSVPPPERLKNWPLTLLSWGCSISPLINPARSVSTKGTFWWCIPMALRTRKTSRKKCSGRKDC